jgi:hypothetical protein
MDVDADGSDADRMPVGTGAPANFKPSTSYRWPKKTDAPNPYLAATEERLKRAEDEYALATTTAARKRELGNTVAELRAEVATLKKFSFLIGATDPFIVVPGAFTHSGDPVKPGDYALVVFGDSIYPAIVGDVGPNDKVGEASLRIAKQINTLSTPYNRPVSDLKVTYIMFPGTAEKSVGPPDLEKLHARCEELVKEIGGATVPLYHWENIIPASPTPSPTPNSSPSPSGTPSAASPAGSASPSPTFAFPVTSPAATTPAGSPGTATNSPAASRSPHRKRKP